MDNGSTVSMSEKRGSSHVDLDGLRMRVLKRNGKTVELDHDKLIRVIKRLSKGFEKDIDIKLLLKELRRNIYDGISTQDLEKALILSAVAYLEKDPAYNKLAAYFFLQRIYREVLEQSVNEHNLEDLYRKKFIENIHEGIKVGRLNKELATFPLEELSKKLCIERDFLFRYRGIQTLYERYFLRSEKRLLELPQAFWMRVAMGLAIKEENKAARAIEFYEVLSSLRFLNGTPTLLHSGLVHSQLSSCFLTYVDDDLNHIFKCYKDNARLAKFSGGLGNDWTPLRATGALIKTINVNSQGVIPFLKIANDVISAISRSGSRRGAAAVYLETWHYDIEDFIDLRRNTGDERRRTPDMNTANWIPDLFMKRVMHDKEWTLFSPDEVPDLHDLYGKKFEEAYEAYEEKARQGKIKLYKTISAKALWRKMLSRLFETGHPWITFKDACNIRSPQDHCGVVHSSNLCTEITLNTSREETAVCNIGSINLAEHFTDGKFNEELMCKTIDTAIRMLDNTIDNNFYPTMEAENSNMRHRPVGLGVMGLQDVLFLKNLAFDDPEALHFTDKLFEKISYCTILGSSKLAKEKGSYSSFKGSKWDRGIMPHDTLELLEKERGMLLEVDKKVHFDWAPVREHIQKYGMRNSNVMAIAPTATISNIAGCFPTIEPVFKNIYVKANMGGEFTVVNEYLVEDLKQHGLWDQDMIDEIKFYDGSIQAIDRIPDNIKQKYKESFEIDPKWLTKLNAIRSKWIDQSQSFNLFVQGTSGKLLSEIYFEGWKAGVKTFYYLRTMGASQIEKSTLDAKKYGFTQKRNGVGGAVKQQACNIDDLSCESCQ